jgi:hypothetical protein
MDNLMNNYHNHLSDMLQKHITLNLSRTKCLTAFIISMLQCRTVNLALLCNVMPSNNAKSESWYRRLQRFVAEVSIPWRVLPKMLVSMMALEEREQWVLCMDRTNWKFGKKHINILYLAVSFNGIAIPLFGVF